MNFKVFAFSILGMAGIMSCSFAAKQQKAEANADTKTSAQVVQVALERDTFKTGQGRQVVISFIGHGTLMLDVDGYIIHVDPVSMFGADYTRLPKADLLLVGHKHSDHYDSTAIAAIQTANTLFVSNQAVAKQNGKSTPMTIGESKKVGKGIILTATAAYNYSEGKTNFHPKERDIGFLLDIDDLRIYIANDTEDIPEMAQLKGVDIAFLPVNQPYTMTVEQAIHATDMIRPSILYPYHYGETDLTPLVEHFKDDKTTEVRIRQMQ